MAVLTLTPPRAVNYIDCVYKLQERASLSAMTTTARSTRVMSAFCRWETCVVVPNVKITKDVIRTPSHSLCRGERYRVAFHAGRGYSPKHGHQRGVSELTLGEDLPT